MDHFVRSHFTCLVVIALTMQVAAFGQGVGPSAGVSSKSIAPDSSDTAQLTVPGSATGSLTNQQAVGADATFGVQVWKKDHSLIGGFFTYAPSINVSGQPKAFGTFLLTPPAQGTSFSVVANHLLGIRAEEPVGRLKVLGLLPKGETQ